MKKKNIIFYAIVIIIFIIALFLAFFFLGKIAGAFVALLGLGAALGVAGCGIFVLARGRAP